MYATGLNFDIWAVLDKPDIQGMAQKIEGELVATQGAEPGPWDMKLDFLKVQFEERAALLQNGDVPGNADNGSFKVDHWSALDAHLYEAMKDQVSQKIEAAQAQGVKDFDAFQKSAITEFLANAEAGINYLHSGKAYDDLKIALNSDINQWEQQRELGLSGGGYHTDHGDVAGHIIPDHSHDYFAGGNGFDTLDFNAWDSGLKVDMSKHYMESETGAVKFVGFSDLVGSSHDDWIKGSKHADVIDGGAGNDVLRGLGGADTLTGGSGSDTFVWYKKDVVAQTKAGDVDHVTDFSKDDRIDLTNLFKKSSLSIDEKVVIKDADDGSHIFARANGEMHEVAVLDHIHGLSASDMLTSGMLLA